MKLLSIWFIKKGTVHQEDEIVSELRQVIEVITPEVAESTKVNYITAVNKLAKFLNESRPRQQLTAKNIPPGQVKAMERWLLDNGMSPNYTALLMRCLRALVNRINQRGYELFKDVRTSRCDTVKRAVSEETMKKLRKMQLDSKPKEDMARNIFLFCFFCMGMPLIDAVYLKKTQLKNGIITYYRRKTRRMVNVVVTDELQAIIKAIGTNASSPYLLPILTEGGNLGSAPRNTDGSTSVI